MKYLPMVLGFLLAAVLIAGGWILIFHTNWIKPPVQEEEEVEPETDVPVKTGKITRATFHRYVTGFGVIAPALASDGKPASGSRVGTASSGIVAEVLCREGQIITLGAPLLRLDDRTAKAEENKAEAALKSAQASLTRVKASTRPEQLAVARLAASKARKARETAEKDFNRQRTLATEQLASEKQVEEAGLAFASARDDQESAEKQLALLESSPSLEELAEALAKVNEAEQALAAARTQTTLLTIKAPIPGTIVKFNVNRGESVDTSTVLAEIADLARLEVAATVTADELRALKPGQNAQLYLESGKEPLLGKLSFVGTQVDPKTNSVSLRVAVPVEAGLKPGQFARVEIIVEEHPDSLAVPAEAVFEDKDGIPVVSVVEDGKASLQNVTVGLREKELVEVSGKEIKEGDTIVTTGAYGLPEDTKIHIIGE